MSNRTECEFSSEIVKLLRTNGLSEDDKKHFQTCADCRETARIIRFFQTDTNEKVEPVKLPTAGLIWWKHERSAKKRAAKRAAQPIYIVQILAAVIAFTAFIWMLPELPPLAPVFGQVFAAVGQLMPLLAAGLICFAVISTTLILILRRFLIKN